MIETLSVLIHAYSKAGKTTLAATSPPPILALDAEGGWKFIPLRQISWDPVTGPPPIWDGTWDVCHVSVNTWQTLQFAHQYLQLGQHNFQSIVVDSITEIQRRLKENLVGSEALKMQDWGVLLSKMDSLIRGLRDLTLHPTRPVRVVVFIAETRDNGKGKMIPTMQGQISSSLPYWMDIVGYLFVEDVLNESNQPSGVKVRRLLIAPNDKFEAGERVQGKLPAVIDYPNITQMLIDVYPSLLQQQ